MRLVLALMVLAGPVWAAECPVVPEPVVTLDHGSRYTDGSKTRSDFDPEGNAAVEAALGPVDDFITDLARGANAARKADDPVPDATCVLDAAAAWARADALSDLVGDSPNLSVPSRWGGIAFAVAAVRPLVPADAARDAAIDGWLRARSQATMTFFDAPETPPRAARNNLRAWAALAVLRAGLTLNDEPMILWAEDSFRVMLCEAGTDGSLPLEMQRGPLSLHYQLHALAPLVTGAAMLSQAGRPEVATVCDAALARVVGFTMAAVDDPALVEALAGEPQKIEEPKPFELAWMAAWGWLGQEPDLSARAAAIESLGHSKLGGDQRLAWPPLPDPVRTGN